MTFRRVATRQAPFRSWVRGLGVDPVLKRGSGHASTSSDSHHRQLAGGHHLTRLGEANPEQTCDITAIEQPRLAEIWPRKNRLRRRFLHFTSPPATRCTLWPDRRRSPSHWRDRTRAMREVTPELMRRPADRVSGRRRLRALPMSLPAGAIETAVPAQPRAIEPAEPWAKRRAEKMTTGEKAAIKSTATPLAILFSVVSVS